MLSAEQALELYTLLTDHGVTLWLDGGWGVDALLGEETRPHEDLDIVFEDHHLPLVRALLEAQGFVDVPRGDTAPWNFVLGDSAGRLVDIHAVTLDANGEGRYGAPERWALDPDARYPAGALTGTGSIRGAPVLCIAPEAVVSLHTRYAFGEKDVQDVKAICDRFGLPYPPEYARVIAGEALPPGRPGYPP